MWQKCEFPRTQKGVKIESRSYITYKENRQSKRKSIIGSRFYSRPQSPWLSWSIVLLWLQSQQSQLNVYVLDCLCEANAWVPLIDLQCVWYWPFPFSPIDPGSVYEVKLVAYNGNGESDCSKKLVSLAEDGTSAKTRAGKSAFPLAHLNMLFIFKCTV